MGNENVGEPIWFEYEYPVDDGYYDPQGHALYKMKREHPEQFAAQRKKVAATKVENAATAALIKPTAEVSAARPTTDDEHVEEIQVEARPVSGRQRATDSSHRINFPEAVSRHGSRNDLARVHSSSGALFSDGRAPSLRMLNEELHRSNNNIHALLQGRNQVLASTTPAFHGGLQLPSDLGSSAALATSSATHDHDASISIEVEDTVAPLVRSPSFTSRRNSLTMSSPQQSPAQMHRFMQAHAPALDILSETEQSVRALPTLSDEIDSEEEIEDVTVVDPAAARAMLYEEATTPAARRRHLSGTQFAASPSFSHRSRFNEMNSAAAAFAASRRASLKEGDALMVAESQRRLMVAQIAASIGKPVEDAIDVDISKDEADAIMRTPRRRTSLKLMALSLGGGSSGNSPAARRMSLNGTDNGVEMDDERMAIMQLRRLSVGGQSSAVDPLVATPMTIHQRRASIVRQQQSQPDVTPPIPVNVAAELEAERIREELINLIGYDLVVAQEEAKRKRDDQSAIVMGGDDDAASDQS